MLSLKEAKHWAIQFVVAREPLLPSEVDDDERRAELIASDEKRLLSLAKSALVKHLRSEADAVNYEDADVVQAAHKSLDIEENKPNPRER